MITLVSKDGEKQQYAKSVCDKSVFLRGVLEENEDDEIPCEVSSSELKTVMKFCDYIKDNAFPTISKPLATNDFSECLQSSDWFIDFVQTLDH